MTFSQSSQRELQALIDALCEGCLSDAQAQRLEQIVCEDVEAARFYLDYMSLHGALMLEHSDSMEQPLAGLPESLRYGTSEPLLLRLLTGARGYVSAGVTMLRTKFNFREYPIRGSLAIASLVMIVVLGVLAIMHAPNVEPSSGVSDWQIAHARAAPARILRLWKCRWADRSSELRVGSPLDAGETVELLEGTAEIKFRAGARVAVQGPASLRVEGDGAMSLERGRLLARVSKRARGFTVETPQVDVVDLGTEFGVEIRGQETEVQVFEGKVQTRSHREARQPVQTLVAGEAASFGSSLQGFYVKEKKMNRAIYLALAAMLSTPASDASATPILWFDATDFTSANLALSTWTNKGSGGDATADAGREPSVVLGGIGGNPVVRFDDSGLAADRDSMNTGNTAIGSKTMHAFLVLETADNSGHALVYESNGTADLVYFAFMQSANIYHGARFDGAGANRLGLHTGSWNTASPGLLSSLISADASGELRVNGGGAHASPSGTTFGTLNKRFFIGSQASLGVIGDHLAGDIGEIIVFDSELTSDQRIGLEYLLGQKWGLTGIPVATESQIEAADALFPGGFVEVAEVPEPSSGVLFAIGGFVCYSVRRRSRRAGRIRRERSAA